jgi:predicted porin
VNIKTTLKTSVAAAALFAVAAPVATSPATAGAINAGQDKMSVSISGQVNKEILYHDDGQQGQTAIVDNAASNTRWRIVAKGNITESVSVESRLETSLSSSPSSAATTANKSRGTGQNNFTIRVAHIKFTHKSMGSVTLGQSWEATDGIQFQDQDGAWLVAEAFSDHTASGVMRNTAGATTGTTATWSSIDGGRDDEIRYDSPTFGGLRIAASYTNGDEAHVAAFYGGSFGGISVGAAIGVITGSDDVTNDSLAGSIGLAHDSGVSVLLVAGEVDFDGGGTGSAANTRPDGSNIYGKIAYDTSLNDLGGTSFAIGYGETSDLAANGTDIEMLNFGVAQSVSAIGATMYAGATRITADTTSTNFDDYWAAYVGARVKF